MATEVPTEHMLADALTKRMASDLLIHFMKTNEYGFKYNDKITHIKADMKQQRRRERKERAKAKLASEGGA